MNTELSILIPAFNEEENINKLLTDISENFTPLCNFEVILVDDGSDNILSKFIEINDYDFKLKIISNFNKGQSASIKIALENVEDSSNLIGLIDGDGQNPPIELQDCIKNFWKLNVMPSYLIEIIGRTVCQKK